MGEWDDPLHPQMRKSGATRYCKQRLVVLDDVETLTLTPSYVSLAKPSRLIRRLPPSVPHRRRLTINHANREETTIHFWGPKSSIKPSLILIHGFGPHGVWQWRPQNNILFMLSIYTFLAYSSAFTTVFHTHTTGLRFFKQPASSSFSRNLVFKSVPSLGLVMVDL
ncbi:hypothetical protein HAX54_002196 [Datura stramonium]|uniref:Uncharacterized protein n=1 Tax=Datura stramonium TaxID=4076 RepID=A0ABS8RTL4_DATST|nr:hypothetical protein [Datura stramonium]